MTPSHKSKGGIPPLHNPERNGTLQRMGSRDCDAQKTEDRPSSSRSIVPALYSNRCPCGWATQRSTRGTCRSCTEEIAHQLEVCNVHRGKTPAESPTPGGKGQRWGRSSGLRGIGHSSRVKESVNTRAWRRCRGVPNAVGQTNAFYFSQTHPDMPPALTHTAEARHGHTPLHKRVSFLDSGFQRVPRVQPAVARQQLRVGWAASSPSLLHSCSV